MTKTDAVLDLSSFMPHDDAIIEILDPSGLRGTGWKVTLAGPGHPKTIAGRDHFERSELRRQRQIETARLNGRKVKPEDREADDLRRDNVEMIVARIVTWTPVKIGSETFEFSDGTAADLLLRPSMAWALKQIAEAITDDNSFTQRSATN